MPLVSRQVCAQVWTGLGTQAILKEAGGIQCREGSSKKKKKKKIQVLVNITSNELV